MNYFIMVYGTDGNYCVKYNLYRIKRRSTIFRLVKLVCRFVDAVLYKIRNFRTTVLDLNHFSKSSGKQLFTDSFKTLGFSRVVPRNMRTFH